MDEGKRGVSRFIWSWTTITVAGVLSFVAPASVHAQAELNVQICEKVDWNAIPDKPVPIRYGITGGGEEPLALLWSDPESYAGNGRYYEIKAQQFAPNDRMTAVQSGNLDAGSITLPALITATRVGIPIKGVASIVETSKTDNQGAFVVLGDSGIKTLQDLKGKRVSIMGPNTISEYWVKSAVKQAGLKPNAVSYVSLPLPANEQALRNKQIDVAWLARQFLARAQKEGGIEILMRPIDATNQAHPTTVAFFTQRFLEQEPLAYCAWLRDYQAALANWKTNREALYSKLIASKYVTPASAMAGPDGGRSEHGQLDLEAIDKTIVDMAETDFLPPGKKVTARDLVLDGYSFIQ